jgi:hypothetical protein
MLTTNEAPCTNIPLNSLELEKSALQEHLDVTLSETKAYIELIHRFPDQSHHLNKFIIDAKHKSIEITGKINALGKVLETLHSSPNTR